MSDLDAFRVQDLLADRELLHHAFRVRDLLGHAVRNHAADLVRNLLDLLLDDRFIDGVRHHLDALLLHHAARGAGGHDLVGRAFLEAAAGAVGRVIVAVAETAGDAARRALAGAVVEMAVAGVSAERVIIDIRARGRSE